MLTSHQATKVRDHSLPQPNSPSPILDPSGSSTPPPIESTSPPSITIPGNRPLPHPRGLAPSSDAVELDTFNQDSTPTNVGVPGGTTDIDADATVAQPAGNNANAPPPSCWKISGNAFARGITDGAYTFAGKITGETAAGAIFSRACENDALLWSLRLLPPLAGLTWGATMGYAVGDAYTKGRDTTAEKKRLIKIGLATVGAVVLGGIGALTPVSLSLQFSKTTQIAYLARSTIYPIIRDLLTQSTTTLFGQSSWPDDQLSRTAKDNAKAAACYLVWSLLGGFAQAGLGSVPDEAKKEILSYLGSVSPHVAVSAAVEMADTISGTLIRSYSPLELGRPEYEQGASLARPDPVATYINAHARYVAVNLVQLPPSSTGINDGKGYGWIALQSALNAATEFRGMASKAAKKQADDGWRAIKGYFSR